jgi:hypothetical protein
MSLLRHYRRPHTQLDGGDWTISCDCGWEGRTSCMEGRHVKSGDQVARDLENAVTGHLADGEREIYLLIDAREEWIENDKGELVKGIKGNFVMPIGRPVYLTSHHRQDGTHYGHYLDPETGVAGTLPVGEVRTADHQVFKLDTDA